MQTTSKVFMVKPVRFGFNEETATNNAFQKKGHENNAQENALREFLAYTALLKANGVTVITAEDTERPFTPDSIFPNNWFSTHKDGSLVLYPMFAENRRKERKSEFLDVIKKNFEVKRLIDLTYWETDGLFLEGTGSMIFDRDNKTTYICRSPRSSEKVISDFCKKTDYKSVVFDAVDQNGNPIYHTNVMMCIGSKVAIVCLEAIVDSEENKAAGISSRQNVSASLKAAGKEIMEISFEQMNNFAGNMLEVHNEKGENFIIMSATARKSLTADQVKFLNSKFSRILSPHLDTIEENGGGSARCMMAEIM